MKEELRRKSIQILGLEKWNENWIGSGKILKKIVQTIELKNNNLVGTRRKFGPNSVPHRGMIDALEKGTKLKELEKALYELLCTKANPELLFNRMIELIGKQYSVIAWLFYLKNDREYLPISTSNFEYAFKTFSTNRASFPE